MSGIQNPLLVNRSLRFENIDSVEYLMEIRERGEVYADVVDDHMFDLWTKFITSHYLDRAFTTGNTYLIETAILALNNYNGSTTPIPDIARYDFNTKFKLNTYLEIDQLLVKYGFINTSNALHHACSQLHYTRIRFLLENGADPNVVLQITPNFGTNCYGHLLMSMLGTEMKDPEVLRITKLFIEHNADVSEGLGISYTNLPLVKLLVGEGQADVDAKDVGGDTPLINFIKDGSPFEAIRVLLDAGADVNETGHNGVTAFRVVFGRDDYLGNLDLLLLLLDKGSNITPRVRLITFLEEVGSLAMAPNDIQKTIRVIRHLLQRGLTIAERDLNRYTVFMNLLDTDVLRFLIDEMRRRNLNLLEERNNVGDTALSFAYESRELENVKLLLSSGASIGTMFDSIERDTPAYEDFQREVDRYVSEFLGSPGVVSPIATFDTLNRYLNNRNFARDEVFYILMTKNVADLQAFGRRLSVPRTSLVSDKRELVEAILNGRR
jgi:ankyrin repeat protein